MLWLLYRGNTPNLTPLDVFCTHQYSADECICIYFSNIVLNLNYQSRLTYKCFHPSLVVVKMNDNLSYKTPIESNLVVHNSSYIIVLVKISTSHHIFLLEVFLKDLAFYITLLMFSNRRKFSTSEFYGDGISLTCNSIDGTSKLQLVFVYLNK